jgi:tetratricopeptide (TPR) repeat protein
MALSGNTVHVTAQLIHAATDRHVWSKRYERDTKDVIALQVEIARAIAAALDNRIEPSSTSSSSHTQVVNPDAYDLYLKGKQASGRLEYERLRAAASYFEQAVARQPDFARAHASLALARLQFLYVGPRSPGEVLPTVEAAARRALALDDTLAEAYRALATSRRVYGDHSGAQAITEKLMKLVSAAESHGLRVGRLLRERRFQEAIVEAERRQAADPLSVNATHLLARTRRAAGDYVGALAELQKALSMEPGRPNTYYELGVTYVLKGDIRAAIPQFEQAITHSSKQNPRFRAYLAYAYAMAGNTREARRILEELLNLRERQYVSLFGIALIHDALGEKAAALTALEGASREHAVEFIQLRQYPPFRTLVGEPRYRDLMGRGSTDS